MVYILLCLLYLLSLLILSINMQYKITVVSSLHHELFSVHVAAISLYCLLNKSKTGCSFFWYFYTKLGFITTACNREKNFGKIFCQKWQRKLSAVTPKTETFFWFFLQIDLIVLLSNSDISNFILGHNDLKLDCLY